MICFPNPKINLGLNIINKREDGFHNLETVFYPTQNITDVLEIGNTNTTQINVTGTDLQIPLEDNIVYKAYQLIAKDYDIDPLEIHLHKSIPHGAGLGGGSADASQMLLLLNNFFKLNLNTSQLLKYAAQLGSDCPFFIYNTPCWATGRGELLEPITLDLSQYKIALVQPIGISVNTGKAFAGITPQKPQISALDIIKQPISEWKNNLVNDFEKSVFAIHPSLDKIKVNLYEQGSIYASMSGSGSCLFGIFEQEVNLALEDVNIWWA